MEFSGPDGPRKSSIAAPDRRNACSVIKALGSIRTALIESTSNRSCNSGCASSSSNRLFSTRASASSKWRTASRRKADFRVLASTIVNSTGRPAARVSGSAGEPPPEPTSISLIARHSRKVARGNHRFQKKAVDCGIGVVERGQVDLPVPALQQLVVETELFRQVVGKEHAGLRCPACEARPKGDRSHLTSVSALQSIDVRRDNRHGRRRHAGNARGLTERSGTNIPEPLDHLA